MGKTKVIELTTEQRLALENGYRKGKSHTFRVRCQIVLLKSKQRASLEDGEILGGCEIVVNKKVTPLRDGRPQGFSDAPGGVVASPN